MANGLMENSMRHRHNVLDYNAERLPRLFREALQRKKIVVGVMGRAERNHYTFLNIWKNRPFFFALLCSLNSKVKSRYALSIN